MAKKPIRKAPADAHKVAAAGPLKKPALKATFKPDPRRVQAEPPPLKKIKSPLSKSELDEFRQMLLEKRRGLLGDMTGIEAEALRTNRQEGSGDLSNMPTHPADIGTDNFEQEFTLGLLESERTLMSEINAALERIDAGIYGVCLGTGKPISLARLRARPWSKYGIEYARLIEKGLVQPGAEHRGTEEPQEETQEPAEPEDEEEFVEEETEE